MSTDFSIYVGTFVKLSDPIDRDPIVLGPASYWGCANCHDVAEDAVRRNGEQFCCVCSSKLEHVNTVRHMDDCLGNLVYEEHNNLPVIQAVNNIGDYISLELEDVWEAILVDDPQCFIVTPDIGFYDSYCDDDCKGDWSKLSPSGAIRHIEDKHVFDIVQLKKYYNKVEVVYGVIHRCN